MTERPAVIKAAREHAAYELGVSAGRKHFDEAFDRGYKAAKDEGFDQLQEVAKWLQRQGYPFDYCGDEPPPAPLLTEVARAWAIQDRMRLKDYAHSIEMETGWKVQLDDRGPELGVKVFEGEGDDGPWQCTACDSTGDTRRGQDECLCDLERSS